MVLVTGGAGYIGSHTCISLIESGYDIVVFDNFCNSSKESINRVEKIVGRKIPIVEGDIRNKSDLNNIFKNYDIDSVIHFAGLKAVGESVDNPLSYYDNNVNGTVCLLKVMKENSVKSIVFSSSATVYGDPHTTPITEDFPLSATNPYGRTKLMIEEILNDLYTSDKEWKIVILRYFNPVGAHMSGLIGEDPNDIPNNLMPFISQTAVGKRECLNIYGNDYNTKDGTGVRDYIHVVDLAKGHVSALNKIQKLNNILTVNLGTGKGYSVLEMVNTFENVTGKKVPYKIVDRRKGDVAVCYANANYARKVLEWEATKNIEDMCRDSWRWQSINPNGYSKS